MSLLTIYSIGLIYFILVAITDYDKFSELMKNYSTLSVNIVSIILIIIWPIMIGITTINNIIKILKNKNG